MMSRYRTPIARSRRIVAHLHMLIAMHTATNNMHHRNWCRRETEAHGQEKVKLGALAAAVIAVREGLRPLTAGEYAAMAEGLGLEGSGAHGDGGDAAAPAAAALQRLPWPGSGLTDDEMAEIARRRAALALSPAGAALAAQQVPCCSLT